MNIDVTQEQLDRFYYGDELIHEIFPDLNPNEREFIKTGITPAEWSKTFRNQSV